MTSCNFNTSIKTLMKMVCSYTMKLHHYIQVKSIRYNFACRQSYTILRKKKLIDKEVNCIKKSHQKSNPRYTRNTLPPRLKREKKKIANRIRAISAQPIKELKSKDNHL